MNLYLAILYTAVIVEVIWSDRRRSRWHRIEMASNERVIAALKAVVRSQETQDDQRFDA